MSLAPKSLDCTTGYIQSPPDGAVSVDVVVLWDRFFFLSIKITKSDYLNKATILSQLPKYK
jgi:hypothetical protein